MRIAGYILVQSGLSSDKAKQLAKKYEHESLYAKVLIVKVGHTYSVYKKSAK